MSNAFSVTRISLSVTPAKAGAQTGPELSTNAAWVPAFAGMTVKRMTGKE